MLGDDGGDGIFSARIKITRCYTYEILSRDVRTIVNERGRPSAFRCVYARNFVIIIDVIYNRCARQRAHTHTSLAVAGGYLLRAAGEFIFGWRYVTTIVLTVVLVVMAGHIIQFLVDSAGKHERRQRMEVR